MYLSVYHYGNQRKVVGGFASSQALFFFFCFFFLCFLFLSVALAFGLLSWGHLIFNNIIDLPYLRWTMTHFSSRKKLSFIFMLSLCSCFDTIYIVKSAT